MSSDAEVLAPADAVGSVAQMATLVGQSCHSYPQVWKEALQRLLAWVQDLIRARSTMLQTPEK